MTRAERKRQARMQEKCQVPLNLNLTVAQVAGMTGQQASDFLCEKKGIWITDNYGCNKWESEQATDWRDSMLARFLRTRGDNGKRDIQRNRENCG